MTSHLPQPQKHDQNISVGFVELALLRHAVDSQREPVLYDIINIPLHIVELALMRQGRRLRQLVNWRPKQNIRVAPPNHELRQPNKQALRVFRNLGIAVIVLEDLEGAGVSRQSSLLACPRPY